MKHKNLTVYTDNLHLLNAGGNPMLSVYENQIHLR